MVFFPSGVQDTTEAAGIWALMLGLGSKGLLCGHRFSSSLLSEVIWKYWVLLLWNPSLLGR